LHGSSSPVCFTSPRGQPPLLPSKAHATIKRPVRKRVFERQLHLRFVKTRLRPMAIPGGCAAKQSCVTASRNSRLMRSSCRDTVDSCSLSVRPISARVSWVHVIARQEHAFARRQPTRRQPRAHHRAGRDTSRGPDRPAGNPRAAPADAGSIFFPEFRRGASRELVGCLTFFGFERNRPPARSQQVHMPLGKHGPEPCGKLAPAVKIFKQGFSPSASGRTDAVEFRVERVRQLLRAGLIPRPRRRAEWRGRAARSSCRKCLIKNSQAASRPSPHAHARAKSSRCATTSGKLTTSAAPARAPPYRFSALRRRASAKRLRARPHRAPFASAWSHSIRRAYCAQKSVERRDSGFLCHVVRTAFRCLDAS